ncbi:hypothetical protein CISIN_1g047458mg [Citrus sinensis]|uniref:Myb/SANT-like domain-containing protein n=2 Tax=Citrus TaxID=2706 RepID=A0A067F1N8_CITSI|nr:hypothetical protein CISIN_1g047458mg [Citrus sinensis]
MATDSVSQDKSKAIWDPKSHEIWVNLAVEQVRASNGSGTHLSKQHRNRWDIVKKEWQIWDALKHPEAAKFRIKGLDHAFMLDELFHDVTSIGASLGTNLCFENIIDDDIVSVDSANSEEVNHDEIGYSDRLEKIPPRRKQLKKANRKISVSSKLTKQLDELYEAIKNKDSYIRTNPLDCSVQEANRETFVALSKPEYQLQWLKDQQDDI